ncbi:MAG: VOC family protein [Sulfitobacter sp.]
MLQLDHIAIAGGSLAEATAHVEASLGISMQQGGEHDVFHTHNSLLGLSDGLYLEAIAINPMAPRPDRPRWFDLDRFSGPPRLTNWICACDDLDATLAKLPGGFGHPVALQRGDLKWRMAVPNSGILPFDNCAPALIEWQTGQHPAQRLVPSDMRLARLRITHPDARDLAEFLALELNDPRIVFAKGAPGLSAEFESRMGKCVL